jgi:hypothetical protein
VSHYAFYTCFVYFYTELSEVSLQEFDVSLGALKSRPLHLDTTHKL